MQPHSVLITGASGFLGRALATDLMAHKTYRVVTTSRYQTAVFPQHHVCDLLKAPLEELCEGIDTIIHLAARAHITKEHSNNPAMAFHDNNVTASIRLAQAALAQKVQRFIFISTIGVLGNATQKGAAYTEQSFAAPHSAYAQSKWAAEQALTELFKDSNVTLLILRLPLIYHIAAPANFGALVHAVQTGRRLPFARINNRRSMLARSNFISFMHKALQCPHWSAPLYLLSDPQPYSTTSLLQGIGTVLNCPPRLFHVPQIIMALVLTLLRRTTLYQQLWGSLEIDSTKAQQAFNWTPCAQLESNLKK